ncbi:replication/maintenance protein RepL, partial [Staphylococcus aureus]|uniref:replication/maintenance protein RepL n=1 Tax=Staphylococcus aureus TaxID=1280 RepID=UPI0021CB6132
MFTRVIDEQSGEDIEIDKFDRNETFGNIVKGYIVQLIIMLDMIWVKKHKIFTSIIDNVRLSNNTM